MVFADVVLLAFNFAAFGVLQPWHEATAEPESPGPHNTKEHYDSSSRAGAKVIQPALASPLHLQTTNYE